jgi:hypothetical protein
MTIQRDAFYVTLSSDGCRDRHPENNAINFTNELKVPKILRGDDGGWEVGVKLIQFGNFWEYLLPPFDLLGLLHGKSGVTLSNYRPSPESPSMAEEHLMDIRQAEHMLPGRVENMLHYYVSGLRSHYRNALELGNTISRALEKGFETPVRYIPPSGSRPARFICPLRPLWNVGIVTSSYELVDLLQLPIVYGLRERNLETRYLTRDGVHILGFNSQQVGNETASSAKRRELKSARVGDVLTFTMEDQEEVAAVQSRLVRASSVYVMSDVCGEQEVVGKLIRLLKCIPIRGSRTGVDIEGGVDGYFDDDGPVGEPLSIEYDHPTYVRYCGAEMLQRITITIQAVGKRQNTIVGRKCSTLVQLHFRPRCVYNARHPDTGDDFAIYNDDTQHVVRH